MAKHSSSLVFGNLRSVCVSPNNCKEETLFAVSRKVPLCKEGENQQHELGVTVSG
jgi:hypothetical protein